MSESPRHFEAEFPGDDRLAREVAERRQAEKTLHLVLEGAAGVVGIDFYKLLVQYLAAALEVRIAFVAQIVDPEMKRASVLALMDDDLNVEPFEYEIANTPCERLLKGGSAFFTNRVSSEFPNDEWIRERGIESYLGVPMKDAKGNLIGHMGVMHNAPLPVTSSREAILRVFAARAAAELERHGAITHLERSEREAWEKFAQLKFIYEQAPLGLCYMDTDLRYLRCNEKLAEINGVPVDETLGRTLREVVPQVADTLEPVFLRVIRTGEATDIFVTGTTAANPDKLHHYYSCHYPIKDPEGTVVGISSIVQDITEQRESQQALESSHEQYRSLVETIPLGVEEIDSAGCITATNRAFEEMHDYDPGEMIGLSVVTLVADPNEGGELLDYISHLVRDQPTPTPYITKHRTKKGRVIDVQVDWNYKRDEKGNVVGFTSVVADISERREAELALERSHERYRSLVETIPHAVKEIDTQGTVTFASNGHKDLLGYEPDELLGTSVKDRLDDRTEPDRLQEYLNHLAKEQPPPTPYVSKVRTKAGNVIDLQVDWNYKRDSEGKVVGFTSILSDVSDRVKVEQEKQESATQLRQLAENIDEVFWLHDLREKRFVYISPAFETIYGIPVESAYQNRNLWLDLIHPEDRDRIAANFEGEKDGEPFEDQYRIVRADGTTRWIHERGFPVRDHGEETRRIAVVSEDVTERQSADGQAV